MKKSSLRLLLPYSIDRRDAAVATSRRHEGCRRCDVKPPYFDERKFWRPLPRPHFLQAYDVASFRPADLSVHRLVRLYDLKTGQDAHGLGGGGGAVFDTDLEIDLIEIFVDRAGAEAEDLGNIAVGFAGRDPEQHVGLAVG
jgi:hypothetical protein